MNICERKRKEGCPEREIEKSRLITWGSLWLRRVFRNNQNFTGSWSFPSSWIVTDCRLPLKRGVTLHNSVFLGYTKIADSWRPSLAVFPWWQNSKSPVSEEVVRQQTAVTITCCYWKNVRDMEPMWGTFHSLFLVLVSSFLLPSSFSILETSVPIKTIM